VSLLTNRSNKCALTHYWLWLIISLQVLLSIHLCSQAWTTGLCQQRTTRCIWEAMIWISSQETASHHFCRCDLLDNLKVKGIDRMTHKEFLCFNIAWDWMYWGISHSWRNQSRRKLLQFWNVRSSIGFTTDKALLFPSWQFYRWQILSLCVNHINLFCSFQTFWRQGSAQYQTQRRKLPCPATQNNEHGCVWFISIDTGFMYCI
jgi:hypothetical protein